MGRSNDLVDEGRPVVRPFLFQDGHKDEVELVEECAVGVEALFIVRQLDDEACDEVANACAIIRTSCAAITEGIELVGGGRGILFSCNRTKQSTYLGIGHEEAPSI